MSRALLGAKRLKRSRVDERFVDVVDLQGEAADQSYSSSLDGHVIAVDAVEAAAVVGLDRQLCCNNEVRPRHVVAQSFAGTKRIPRRGGGYSGGSV